MISWKIASRSPGEVPAQMELLGLDKDDAKSIDDVFYVLYLTTFFVFVTFFQLKFKNLFANLIFLILI